MDGAFNIVDIPCCRIEIHILNDIKSLTIDVQHFRVRIVFLILRFYRWVIKNFIIYNYKSGITLKLAKKNCPTFHFNTVCSNFFVSFWNIIWQ